MISLNFKFGLKILFKEEKDMSYWDLEYDGEQSGVGGYGLELI